MTTNHIVGFSGGLASAVTAKIVADKHPTSTVLLYHDTKTEPAELVLMGLGVCIVGICGMCGVILDGVFGLEE